MRRQLQFVFASIRIFLFGVVCCCSSFLTQAQQLPEPLITATRTHVLKRILCFHCTTSTTALPDVFTLNEDVVGAGDWGDSATAVPDTIVSGAPVAGSMAEQRAVSTQSGYFDKSTDLIMLKYALMIDTDPAELTNFGVYKFIDQWYGVKYKYGGNDADGIDCSAFSQKLYESIFNVSLERTSRQQFKNSELIKKYEDAAEGDLVFFRIHRLRISHVGVYLANGYFAHASRSRGVTVSSINDKYWRRRFVGCGHVERPETGSSESDFLQ